MPLQGFTRFRKHQVGKQSAILTAVPATRVLPYRGPIVINPNRTFPDVDTGSLDPILAPFSGVLNVTSTWAGKQAYNDLPYILSLSGKGGVTPTGGTAKTWTYTYSSLTADSFDYISDEWGDDTSDAASPSDGIQAYGGVINQYSLGFGQDLSPFDLSTQNIYAAANLQTNRTPSLTVDTSPTWVYGGDSEWFVDTVPGSIGVTKWTDAIRGITWDWNNNLDEKRFANGTNSSNPRFRLSGFGRGARVITVTVILEKTAESINEAGTLDDDPVPTRYLQQKTTSNVIITGSTPYSWTRNCRAVLISRADGEIGGNATITLQYAIEYDPTLLYAVKDVVVNTLAAL